MANSIREYISEESLARLYGVAQRFELIEHIKLYQFQDENQLSDYLSQKNYTNTDIIQAYKALVKGEMGVQSPNADYGTPEYRRYRSRFEYTLEHILSGQQIYALEKLDAGAQRWVKDFAGIKVEKPQGKEKAKTLSDVKTYAEFRQLRAKNPKIPERAWIYKQHYNAYQWEKLIHKFSDKNIEGIDTKEKETEWGKELKNIGLRRVTSKEQFDKWRSENKIDLPDEVWEQRTDYNNYHQSKSWEDLAKRYAPKMLPKKISTEEAEEWKKNPLNNGLINAKTPEELQVFVDDYNQSRAEDQTKLSVDSLLIYSDSHEAWTNPEEFYLTEQQRTVEAEKVKAEMIERDNAAIALSGAFTPDDGHTERFFPEAAEYNHPDFNPYEDDENFAEATKAEVLDRAQTPSVPIFYESNNEDDSDEGSYERGGTPSGRPHIRQAMRLRNLLRGGLAGSEGAALGASGTGIAGASGLGTATGGGALVAGGGVLGGSTVTVALLIAAFFIVVILIFFLISLIVGGGQQITDIPLSFTKSGPAAVANNEEIAYTLSANYPGEGNDIVISDKLAEDVEVVDEKTTKPYTLDAASRTITWSVKQLGTTTATASAVSSSSTKIDVTTYTKSPFSLPSPNGSSDASFSENTIQSLNELGSFVAKHQSYLTSTAKNNNPTYVDPFVSVIWTGAIELTNGNQFSWNCRDNRSIKINNGCSGGFTSGGWQVGYGIQVAQAASHIEDDFNEVYGTGSSNNGQKVAEVGQKVIDASSASPDGQIVNPRFFPTESLSSLLVKARGGDANAQQALAILLMDKELGAVVISREIAGDIAGKDNWKATMEGWGSYYSSNMQNFANRMGELATKYTGGSGTSSGYLGSHTVTLTVRPKKENTYVINVSKAQVLGARGKNGTKTTGAGTAPNAENCQGKYVLNNSIGKNFGDPNCNFTPDGLGNLLREQDSANAELWYQIARCESGHNPNAWRDPNIEPKTPDPAGAWGLFQMGSAINGPGTFGNGQNGVYDRGDVEWPLQVSNAVNYYKTILQPRGSNIGAYWQCAR